MVTALATTVSGWSPVADARPRRAPATAAADAASLAKGQWITWADALGIYVIRPDGTGRRTLVANHAPDHNKAGPRYPAWSPNGRRLAYAQMNYQRKTSSIVVANPNGGGRKVVARGFQPSWITNDKILFRPSLKKRGYLRVLTLSTRHVEVLDQDWMPRDPNYALSPDGTEIAWYIVGDRDDPSWVDCPGDSEYGNCMRIVSLDGTTRAQYALHPDPQYDGENGCGVPCEQMNTWFSRRTVSYGAYRSIATVDVVDGHTTRVIRGGKRAPVVIWAAASRYGPKRYAVSGWGGLFLADKHGRIVRRLAAAPSGSFDPTTISWRPRP